MFVPAGSKMMLSLLVSHVSSTLYEIFAAFFGLVISQRLSSRCLTSNSLPFLSVTVNSVTNRPKSEMLYVPGTIFGIL